MQVSPVSELVPNRDPLAWDHLEAPDGYSGRPRTLNGDAGGSGTAAGCQMVTQAGTSSWVDFFIYLSLLIHSFVFLLTAWSWVGDE